MEIVVVNGGVAAFLFFGWRRKSGAFPQIERRSRVNSEQRRQWIMGKAMDSGKLTMDNGQGNGEWKIDNG